MMALRVSTVSAILLFLQAILRTKAAQGFRKRLLGISVAPGTAVPSVRQSYLRQHGGWAILLFQVFRFLTNAALFAVSLALAVRTSLHEHDNAMAIVIAPVRAHDMLENDVD